MLTVSPSVTSEMTLRVVNVNDGRVISGAFNSEDYNLYPLPSQLRPIVDAPDNIDDINIDTGLVSLKFECQDGRTDDSSTCADGHVGTAEVLMDTVVSDNIYSFKYSPEEQKY